MHTYTTFATSSGIIDLLSSRVVAVSESGGPIPAVFCAYMLHVYAVTALNPLKV